MAIREFTVTSVSSPEAQVYVGTEGRPGTKISDIPCADAKIYELLQLNTHLHTLVKLSLNLIMFS